MSLSHFLTVSCSTQRGHMHGGRRVEPVAHLTGLLCAPLMPMGDEARNPAPTETAARQWETFLSSSPDIDVGDGFIVAGVTYHVAAVAPWPWSDGTTYTRIVVEELKDGSS